MKDSPMSSEFAVRVNSLGKCFHVYETPQDRLRQYGATWLRQILPKGLASRLNTSFYQEFWALRDVSFELKPGESMGILGMNGAGKSTLLQLIAGILKPTTGAVEITGRLAGLFELGSGFNPEFTGRENVLLNAVMLGFSREEARERFAGIQQFAGIGDFIDRPVKTYSSGMMVRLAFAVQVQLNPDVLIVDEALAVGDALFQKRCYSRIERFLADGGSLLFVSHDQESVRTLTDKALLLRGGTVACSGASSEVVLEYRRLLHEEENAQARRVVEYLSTSAKQSEPVAQEVPVAALVNSFGNELQRVEPARNRTADMSFGDLDVEVQSVQLRGAKGQSCELFYPGDEIDVRIRYRINSDISGLNLGFRLRNKEGVKIYSGGTMNQDMLHQTGGNDHDECIWSRCFRAGQIIELSQRFDCNLGEGYYEIQAYVTEEKMMVPGHQRMLHWVDEGAFFRVSINKLGRWYGGVTDIRPHCCISVVGLNAHSNTGKEIDLV
jgi:lipopolysaccharide transport system ATP-binding protein